MEFPMMINDGSTDIWEHTVKSLTSHELAHQYFPFYVGSMNEKKYAFMDGRLGGYAAVRLYGRI
ncbi:MAG: hypothetical protein HND39_16875 [Ignavibacteriota bacterium]|nr:MAG: hypothetical protein HND39_16875 [Ignavibacteriota bacterium]